MRRKPTPLSHPFHVLLHAALSMAVIGICASESQAADPVFHIECPADVTVDCNAELWDLSIYGNAIVYGYNGPESAGPPDSTEYDLNSCNAGTIVRTWVAYDYAGTPYYCSQTITVTGPDGDIDIHWPPDYILHSCDPQTDPEDLPMPYDRPVIEGGGGSCTQIMMNHEDWNFDINPPACHKILRKWTVIDWCSYDPNSNDPEGIWEHTQIIKITPENPPVIWCPGDTIVSAGADCSGGYVQLPLAYGSSDCGAGVVIKNNSPYANSDGPDASGDYPLGTTKVTFWADDQCGQTTSCSMYITVEDLKKPTPVCYYGITVTLMQMPDGYYMDLRPSFFNKGSFDNCTPNDKLEMWVEPSRVSCEDLGATEVRLYVEDEAGNVEFCNTLVYVQDNLGICPPPDGNINGTIHAYGGDQLEEVKVALTGTPAYSMTDSTGHYNFTSLTYGHAYTVSPSNSADDLKGVTAMDLAMLLKHILGVQKFTTPYQYIAADLDRSGRVSVSDLLALKDLILQGNLGPGGKTSWRFVDAAYAFQNPDDPLAEAFPESYQIPTLTEDMNALDFIGIKLGDVNDDAAHLVSTAHTDVRSGGVTLHLTQQHFEAGETVEVVVSAEEYEKIEAMQCVLSVDSEMLTVEHAEPLLPEQGLDVVLQGSNNDLVTALWYGVQPMSSSYMFKLTLRASAPGEISDAIKVAATAPSLAYFQGQSEATSVDLVFEQGLPDPGSSTQWATAQFGSNYPNPFDGVTSVPVRLPEACDIAVRIYDLDGKVLWSGLQEGIAGWQEINIDCSHIGSYGMLICRISTEYGNGTLRMLAQPRN